MAVLAAAHRMMATAWESGQEVVETIPVPGGHLINQVQIRVSREGFKTHVKVLSATPCERLRKRSIRCGEILVAALRKLVVDESAGVNPKKLDASLQHNALVFANALMRKVHEMEHTQKESDPGRARKVVKNILRRDLDNTDEGTALEPETAAEATAHQVPQSQSKPTSNGTRREKHVGDRELQPVGV